MKALLLFLFLSFNCWASYQNEEIRWQECPTCFKVKGIWINTIDVQKIVTYDNCLSIETYVNNFERIETYDFAFNKLSERNIIVKRIIKFKHLESKKGIIWK
jgi:Zn-finger nucleic acid-binding protein